MIFFNLIVNGKPADLKDFSRLSDIPIRLIQYFQDLIFFHFFQEAPPEGVAGGGKGKDISPT